MEPLCSHYEKQDKLKGEKKQKEYYESPKENKQQKHQNKFQSHTPR